MGKNILCIFDTLFLKQYILVGSGAKKLFKIADYVKSHLTASLKIEIQDGGKNYSYK